MNRAIEIFNSFAAAARSALRNTGVPPVTALVGIFIALSSFSSAQEISFVPRSAASNVPTLELREEAIITGRDVTLSDVCRWNSWDNAFFNADKDLVIGKIESGKISIDQIQGALRDANVNLGRVRFGGAMVCVVRHGEVRLASAKPQAAIETKKVTDEEPGNGKPLRQFLTEDLAQHLNLPTDSIQIQFAPSDEKTVSLTDSNFKFQIIPQRVRNLGIVRWDVNLSGKSGTRKALIEAYARAWQNELVTTKAIAWKQVLSDSDVEEKRSLVDRLSDDVLLTKAELAGQQASRELKPGTVLVTRMLEAVPLVKAGQLVAVTITRGGVSLTTTAKASEAGRLGQTIRVKNEATKETFDVVLTGPQTAKLE